MNTKTKLNLSSVELKLLKIMLEREEQRQEAYERGVKLYGLVGLAKNRLRWFHRGDYNEDGVPIPTGEYY